MREEKHIDQYPVIEVFGPTIQGEGSLIGQKCIFVRFAGCDYACSWCDTKYAWTHKDAAAMSSMDILKKIEGLLFASGETLMERAVIMKQRPLVVLTGGNPCIHDLTLLVQKLQERGFSMAVETQGSVYQEWVQYTNLITVSPKGPSSDWNTSGAQLDKFLNDVQTGQPMPPDIDLKIVVFDERDYVYAKEVHDRHRDIPMILQVGNKVGDYGTAELLRNLEFLASKVAKNPFWGPNVRVLPQLHVLLWGNKRGV